MRRRYQSIILLIILFASLVIVLRGSVPERSATQIDGTSFLETISGTTLGPPVWSDNLTGQTTWIVNPDNGTTGFVTFRNNSLNLTAFFPGKPYPQAVSLYHRSINVSLDDEPIAFATVSVSKGIHYGMRFAGVEPGDTPLQAWYESDPLQHRLGLSTDENLTANLMIDSYISSGRFPPQNSTINEIHLYIEATPGQTGWFSLLLSRVAMMPTKQLPYANGHAFGGLIIHLNSAFGDIADKSNESVFQIYAGYRIGGTPDLQYRMFFMNGLSVAAEGFLYHLKSLSDYEEADLLPQNVHDFPSAYSTSDENYISIVAVQGSISYFKLDTLTFELLPQTVNVSGYVDPNFARLLYSYYIAFLFVLPVAMTFLFARAFRNESTPEQETTSHS